MKLTSRDWKKLQLPLLLLLFVLGVSIALISFALQFASNQEKSLNAQNDQLLIAKQKYLSSGTEKSQIEFYLPKYQTLIQQGFIGEEQRQLWIQSLREIQTSNQLFPIGYQLEPLEQKQAEFVTSISPFTMQQSTMFLSFDLLHAADVLTLTESLATKTFNNWLLRECSLQRVSKPSDNGSNMHGQCTIEWYTLLEPTNE